MTIKSSIAFQNIVKDIMDRLPAPYNTYQELQKYIHCYLMTFAFSKELKAMHFPYFYPTLNAGYGNAKTINDILGMCNVGIYHLVGNACGRDLSNMLNEETMVREVR